MITDYNLDMLHMTETWLKTGFYCFNNEPRLKDKGGGVAVIYLQNY